jgi:hypothetical protein
MLGKAIIPLGLAAVAALALASGSAHATAGAAPKPSRKTSELSAAELDQIRTVLASADPERMRSLAKELRSKGFTDQATDLESAANAVQAAISGTPSVSPSSPGAAGPTLPSISLPGGGTVRASPGIAGISTSGTGDPGRALAGRTALALTGAVKGSEDKALVAAFQTQERSRGVYDGKIDSLYGPKSALALALDWSIVPPAPLYWPAANAAASKTAYRAALMGFAAKDPQRAEEWSRAAQV